MKAKTELANAAALLEVSNILASPKLLMRVIFHTYNATTLVLKEKYLGDFAEQLLALQLTNPDDAKFIRELHLLLANHKESPVEFVRHEALIICSQEYEINELTPARAQYYLDKAKIFIDKITT